MLLNNFFTLTDVEAIGPDIKASLVINARHKIFEGHFPGQPVVPGVCMMQMVKEIIEQVTAKQTCLVKAQEMKFLAIINPKQNNTIQATLKYTVQQHDIIVMATLFKDELIHFKFKGQFAFL
jgi:3-hydroxyacyl-[acyl-carrier-protein] dehydratase